MITAKNKLPTQTTATIVKTEKSLGIMALSIAT